MASLFSGTDNLFNKTNAALHFNGLGYKNPVGLFYKAY